MAERSVLTDDLVKQLIAVGQVDVLVALPTFRNAATVADVARAAVRGLARHFPRARTAFLNVDGGSNDGTRDVLLRASGPDLDREVSAHSLRTIQRISAPYEGIPAKATALRAVFAAVDLLGARAVAVLDAEVADPSDDWVRALAAPVLTDGRDYVAAAYARHPLDGPLVTQLVRPLVGGVYGRRIAEPIGGEFGCSGAFAAAWLAAPAWEEAMAPLGVDAALSLAALSGPFEVCQASLGARTLAPDVPRPPLADAFRQVVGAVFACMETQAPVWSARDGVSDVPWAGAAPAAAAETVTADPEPLLEGYRSGLRDLGELLDPVLSEATLASLRDAAAREAGAFRIEDEVWAAAVYEFAAAHHHQVIHRDHLVRALVPLYLGRAASFLLECAGRDADFAAVRLEELTRRFEQMKPHLLRRWESPTGGER
ncbi:MAG: hypothetical protein ACM3JJ_06320 [Hyphomicrobiales bacterium]